MKEYQLKAQLRKETGKQNKALRKKGLLPAVLYGPDIKPLNLAVPLKDFSLVYKEAGDSSVISLVIEDKKETHPVIIQEISYEPKTLLPLHIDFYRVNLEKPIRTHLPLKFVGESLAVKNGGILVKAMDHIEVEGLAKDLPQELEVDLTKLKNFGDTFYVKDLVVPPQIKVLIDINNPIATVSEPEEELKPEEAVAPSVEEVKVETEEKKKKRELEEKEEEKEES